MGDEVEVDLLVERARTGDAGAFGALYDRFVERIYRFIAFRVRLPSDAEDLTQLVFVKAIEALPRYEPRGVPFTGWLFRLARNAVIDFERTRHDHLDLDTALERPGEGPGPDELAALNLAVEELSVALHTLTREQQDVIAYRFFGGLSARETAILMGKREGTVRGLQFRALDGLRRRLAASERTPGTSPLGGAMLQASGRGGATLQVPSRTGTTLQVPSGAGTASTRPDTEDS